MAQTQNLILRIVVQRGEIGRGDLLEIGQRFGLSSDAIRAAANGMVRAGLLTKAGRGRGNVRYAVGPQGQTIVNQFIAKFVRYHMALEGQLAWDGNWLVVAFSVPEGQRGKRDGFRNRLTEMGFGLLSSSVWISPVDQKAEVKAAIEEVELGEYVALLRCQDVWIAGVESVEQLAYRVWRLEALETRYRDFNWRIETLLGLLNRLGQGESVDPESLFFDAMGLQGELLEIIMYEDPCLPIELLPSDWPGQRTHELVHALSNVVARLKVAADESYHYLFHALQGMEVLEAFMPEGDETFHWPEEGEGQ